MKARLMVVCGVTWLATLVTGLGATAQIQMANNSIKMLPGPCSCGFGLVWNLHFSTFYTEDPLQANGELVRRPAGSPTSHWGYMLLEDVSMYTSVTLAEIDLPMNDDLNGNGVADFFEISREISTGSTGSYGSSLGGGTLSLTWTRAAGSTRGGCELYMNDAMLGRIGPFNHEFEIVQYGGSLGYQRSQGSSTGTVVLQQGGNSLWRGPVQLVRGASDPYNSLTLLAGVWTNATETFSFGEATLTRDPSRPSIYQGTLTNPSGNFRSWTIWIVDPSDSNGNGIPDLSDDLAIQPPRPPSLELRRVGAGLELLISGDTGRLHEVQSATSLNPQSWEPVTSLILTNDPQAVEISPPVGGPKFWRVEAR